MTDRELLNKALLYEADLRPDARTWLRHAILLLITFVTATIAGTLYPFGTNYTLPTRDPETLQELIEFLVSAPSKYLLIIGDAVAQIVTNPEQLIHGLSFSVSLLFILICHEMGHYIACRLYKVDATLPFFIPTPPMIGPAGTFGAFIKIKSPMPSRKAVFDIGVAGPIAGFIALLPIAVLGVLRMEPQSLQIATLSGGLVFADPLLMQLIGSILGKDPATSVGNAFYFAAWVGLLVTALNLIPSGQLDGGHAIYAVLGEKIHFWTGRIAFVIMAVLAVSGMYFYSSPSGFLIAIILGVMMRVRHPRPWDQSDLGRVRIFIAVATLVIFALCFVPFPIQVL
jgi:membrane-associated protease RseP (regulator of RpoE activity)